MVLGNGGPAPSLSAVTFLVNLSSRATICHGVPLKLYQFVESHASLNVCLVQHLPRMTPFSVMYNDAPVSVVMTDKESLSHATCKSIDAIFSYFAEPNFLFKLCHWFSPSSTSSPQLSPSSSRSPHFARFSIFANSHFVHDLRCKTRRPTEQRTVICDACLCFVQLKSGEFCIVAREPNEYDEE